MKINKILMIAWLLSAAWINETQAQQYAYWNSENIYDVFTLSDKNKLEKNGNDRTIEAPMTHEYFMNEKTTISNIVSLYWDESPNIIREHILQEINNIRKKNGENELKINENLQQIAQKRAESLQYGKMLWNWKQEKLDTELRKSGLTNLSWYWETIWGWHETIKKIIDCQVKTKEQKKTPFFDKYNEIWIWIKFTKVDENGNIIEDNDNTTNKKVYYHITRVIDFIWLNELSPKPITHEDFMNKDLSINDIIYRYWNDALNIMRKHVLQEINQIRKNNGKGELKINKDLQDFAQKRAEYLYNKGIRGHWEWENELRHRLNRSWIDYRNYCNENIWKRQKSINRIVYWQVESEKHYQTMLFDKASEIWIWIVYMVTDKNGNIIKDKNKITSDCTYYTLRVINFIWYDDEP